MPGLAIFFDIGNTNIKIGLALDDEPMQAYTLPTNDRQTSDQFGLTLLDVLRHAGFLPKDIKACLASSVVPGMSNLAKSACQRFLGKNLFFVPDDIGLPLENHYEQPQEVGADRLVGAYAAKKFFPDAASVISIDFGTATTFDCIEGNAYLGGLICPGILSSAGALAANTAKLPRISLEIKEKSPQPGRSTSTSLNHGFLFGFAAMAEGLSARLAEKMEKPVKIIGTGGFALALSGLANCFDAVYPDLLLEGLRFLYKETNKAVWK